MASPPRPKSHRPQTQRMTVALRNICRDYPAGGGVLRELLQNADDAGASSVRFVLDLRTHETDRLLHPGLAQYQGPALLAYNSAIFSDEDFESLSRVGDSRKLMDGLSTGKFGRGFNSVYNWTDSPSIVSRNWLFILDPHQRWSRDFENPGGPLYDFVEDAEAIEMRNQISAFSTIMKQLDRPFQGTIIRIPLRTVAQAETSEICSRLTTVSDIEEVVTKFVSEFGTSGLLFMKNIESIEIEIGDAKAFSIEIANPKDTRVHKTLVNETIKRALTGLNSPFDLSFDVEIVTRSPHLENRASFAVCHSVGTYPADDTLQNWCKAQAMISWVAVAAQTLAEAPEANRGSLFTVLPLHIPTNQPVHIHGLFSLSPDRARLHRNNDGTVQDQLPGKWNEWLFDKPIPAAWVNMLLYLARQYPDRSAFSKWPLTRTTPGDLSHGMIHKVLEIIQGNHLPLWYTEIGYISAHLGLLADGNESPDLKGVLRDVGAPVIYLPNTLLSILQSSNMERLSPASLCGCLEKSEELVQALGKDAKQILLEYMLSDSGFRGYGAIEIFPFEDDKYKSIDNGVAFIHRDETEQALFDRDRHHSLDLGKVSKKAAKILQEGLLRSSLHSSFRQRCRSDFKSYCLSTYFKNFDPNEDVISLDEDAKAFIPKAWDWIVARYHDISDGDISCLWLLPLSDGRYRKLRPQNPSSGTIYAPPGGVGDFIRKIASSNATSNGLVVLAKSFSSRALQLLIAASRKHPTLSIKNGGVLEDFVLWLSTIPLLLEQASDSDKILLQELLVLQRRLCQNPTDISNALRGLKVFQKVTWQQGNDTEPRLSWTSLSGYSQIIGLQDNVPVPDRADVLFLDARLKITAKFLAEFQLATSPSSLDLLENIIISYWESDNMESLSVPCREQITKLLLCNFYNFEKSTRERLKSLAFIPVSRVGGKGVSKFAKASQLIDSSNPLLQSLFFEDEEVCPMEWVIRDYKGILLDCGLRKNLDEALVKDRIKHIENSLYDFQCTWSRARKLLQSKVEWSLDSEPDSSSILRKLKWLPAIDRHGRKVLATAARCRGPDDRLLVKLVLSIVDFDITEDWMQRLGWNEVISSATLLAQLEQGIEIQDWEIVKAVLKYIHQRDRFDASCKELMNLRCVLTQNGTLVNPQKVFRTGCERLGPYLHNVDNGFWHDHSPLLERLGIKERPGIDELLQVQKRFNQDMPLNEADIEVAIEVIKLAAAFDRDLLSSLMIVSATGILFRKEESTYNDLGPLYPVQGTVNFTHRDIPTGVIEKLRIEPLSERIKKGQLGLADADDEDEFDQREEVATGIADTLDRYPIEATFKEYLANGDDAYATQVNWLLDGRQHPQKSLVTSELSEYQGSALVVHNDETFCEKDFEGLKNVGRGSKRDDSTTIGKFGRGSQTMYHFTDVPMLLSGEWLLILDPLQQVLPMSYWKGHRMSGVKVRLSKLKLEYADQLAPFEGLWGYSRDMDYYQGTIFRFPLRPATSQSRLREINIPLDYKAVQHYMERFFDDARVSLLFLRNVQSMDFKIYGETHPRWSVEATGGGSEGEFSYWRVCTVTKGNGLEMGIKIEDRWRTAIQDPPEFPVDLLRRHKRTMKDVECGMAALVPSAPAGKYTGVSPPKSRIFSTLPLPSGLESLDIPVHIHATFLTTGDRQSIVIESSAREAGGDWNRWLLSSAIPNLYLNFLEDLGRKVGKDVFTFWPKRAPPKNSLSELVYKSFWQLLPGSSCRLFPLARQSDVKKKRQPPTLLEIKDAIFDLLPQEKSEPLRGVLESAIPKLVCVPFEIRGKLESELSVASVTPRMLREIFRSEAAAKDLAKCTTKIWEVLLNEIIPRSKADFEELDGCRVLPLVDGTFGMLNMVDPPKPTITYYLCSLREAKLFNFASNVLTLNDQGKDFKAALLKNERKFNILCLSLSHVGVILGKKDFQMSATARSEYDAWLKRFWKYWHDSENRSKESSEVVFASQSGVYNYPILKATRDGDEIYLKPSQLDSLPSVIESAVDRHREIYNKIPGLYRIDSRYMPEYLNEEALSMNGSSFSRLIKSLSLLAAKQGRGFENYLRSIFGNVELEILRDFVKTYFQLETTDQFAMKDLLRQLPIWPSVDVSNRFIAGNTAIIVDNRKLLMPWTHRLASFIKPEVAEAYSSPLNLLGVKKIADTTLLMEYVLPYLPQMIDSQQEKNYELFISAVSRVYDAVPRKRGGAGEMQLFLDTLRNSRLAINGKGRLDTAHTLFDYDDPIFQSAFREEEATRFLSTDVRSHRKFWKAIGLRKRTNTSADANDYVLCLRTMRKRLEARGGPLSPSRLASGTRIDPQLASDTRKVLEPLISQYSAMASSFSEPEWRGVRTAAAFPALTNLTNQTSYRQDAMTSLAASTPLLPLTDVIKHQHIPICWSQTAFPAMEPSEMTFSKLPKLGKPSVEIVWRHLEYLVNSVDNLSRAAIPSFLSNMYATYDYLQDNLRESASNFTLTKAPVWLNLDAIDPKLVFKEDIKSSLLAIEFLWLSSSCDKPPFWAVRKPLMQYERLLKACGCKPIVHPPIRLPDIGSGSSFSSLLQQMRRDEILLDVKLIANGGEIRAHRLVLASASDYFKIQFNGKWSNNDKINFQEISYETLSKVVDFTYTDAGNDTFDWAIMRVGENDTDEELDRKLDDLLDLLTVADRFQMPVLAAKTEYEILLADRKFIQVHNVIYVQSRAAEARARSLENACTEFYTQNKSAVDRVYENGV